MKPASNTLFLLFNIVMAGTVIYQVVQILQKTSVQNGQRNPRTQTHY